VLPPSDDSRLRISGTGIWDDVQGPTDPSGNGAATSRSSDAPHRGEPQAQGLVPRCQRASASTAVLTLGAVLGTRAEITGGSHLVPIWRQQPGPAIGPFAVAPRLLEHRLTAWPDPSRFNPSIPNQGASSQSTGVAKPLRPRTRACAATAPVPIGMRAPVRTHLSPPIGRCVCGGRRLSGGGSAGKVGVSPAPGLGWGVSQGKPRGRPGRVYRLESIWAHRGDPVVARITGSGAVTSFMVSPSPARVQAPAGRDCSPATPSRGRDCRSGRLAGMLAVSPCERGLRTSTLRWPRFAENGGR